jgi:hypothetical protein
MLRSPGTAGLYATQIVELFGLWIPRNVDLEVQLLLQTSSVLRDFVYSLGRSALVMPRLLFFSLCSN